MGRSSLLMLMLFFLFPAIGWSQEEGNEFNDTINREDPNFVTVSLIVASPGDVLYSCVGHACLRMQCPTFNLDNVYSYESEDVSQKVLTFFAGNLKMGMFNIPFADYLKDYKAEGRGVKQYKLNLPPKTKQELWRILDEEVEKGPYLEYDYIKRGCAQSALNFLEMALGTDTLQFGPWPEKYKQTQREFVSTNVANFPWNRLALFTLVGTKADKNCSNEEKIVIPTDLVEVLQNATIHGQKVITDAPKEISKVTAESKPSWCSPMVVAIIILLLAIASWFTSKPYIDLTLLALQTILGLFLTYLVVFSSLPCTNWNWLLIPFNPLPALLWKWRSKWALWFALILILWDVAMWFYPHQLTDWAYTVLVLALVVMYAKQGILALARNIIRSTNIDIKHRYKI